MLVAACKVGASMLRSAISHANTMAAPIEVGSSSEEGDQEDNGKNNDDGTGDYTHMSAADTGEGQDRLWKKIRDKLSKTRADAVTDPDEASLPLGSPGEADVGGHNTEGDLKSNSEDNSRNTSDDILKDNPRNNDTIMAGPDSGDDAPRKCMSLILGIAKALLT
jgi:hypothetical protein